MAEKDNLISKEDLVKVKSLNLIDYFLNYNPDELVKVGKDRYRLKKHDSVYLSNGLWYRFSAGIGKRSALDYFIYVEDMPFKEAADYLLDLIKAKEPETSIIYEPKDKEEKKNNVFKLPARAKSDNIVIQYLTDERMIDKEIVNEMIENNLIYESKYDHSVIFVGYDENGEARFACKRATDSKEKKDISGSNKSYSFSFKNIDSRTVHIFESAIDMLSYMTILKEMGEDYMRFSYLSLDGVSGESSKALDHYLETNRIDRIFLHLDNDEAGRKSIKNIISNYGDRYMIYDDHPTHYKDVNERLVNSKKKTADKQDYIRY